MFIFIWVFPKIMGNPQIIHFNRVFHYKPSILGYPYFRKHPYRYPFLISRCLFRKILVVQVTGTSGALSGTLLFWCPGEGCCVKRLMNSFLVSNRFAIDDDDDDDDDDGDCKGKSP